MSDTETTTDTHAGHDHAGHEQLAPEGPPSAGVAPSATYGGTPANVADVEEALRDVVDPELGINVVDVDRKSVV